MAETCEYCKYYHQPSGECRRNPPVFYNYISRDDFSGEPTTQTESGFPNIAKKEWCGEHQPTD